MPKATIVVPAFNVAVTLAETLTALCAQTFSDLEIVVVDDGSTDRTAEVALSFRADRRVRLVQQANRGLAGARNTGIRAATGEYVGFCDADDLWEPTKLAAHVVHLDNAPEVGLSYSGSALIAADGAMTGCAQKPRLTGLTAAHVFKRNPVGNGSAPVLRRAALLELAGAAGEAAEIGPVFDESFRQSEDIECWLRLALSTSWRIEGVPGLLTRYRITSNGLSAATDRQFASWERMVEKLIPLDPAFFARHAPAARAYQLRYLARRAVSDLNGPAAIALVRRAFASSLRPLVEEPLKTAITVAAACVLGLLGQRGLHVLSPFHSSLRQGATDRSLP